MAKRILFLNGDLLFLRYAWPCVEDKVRARILNEENATKLKAMALCQIAVDRTLVQLCFPVACHKLFVFASQRKLAQWSLDTVREFWRNHHGGKGDCAVGIAIVQGVQEKAVLVAYGKVMIAVFNPYDLEFEINDEVFLHRRVMIETK